MLAAATLFVGGPRRPRPLEIQSNVHAWDADPGGACTRFLFRGPQHYQYRYERTADGFVATAEGDLDGDGVRSKYQLARMQGVAERRSRHPQPDGAVRLDPKIAETNPGE